MEREKYLIITAAGHGLRMGSAVPKQFLLLAGKPILQRTIERFLSACPDLKIITVLPKDCLPMWKDLCMQNNFLVPQKIVTGGITRFHSVKNALAKVPDGALVAIHDGVRPLVSARMICRLFDVAQKCGSAIPAIPMVDTLKVLSKTTLADGSVLLDEVPGETVDRSRIFGAQTPQVFHSEIVRRAYLQPYDPAFTDDASVVRKANMPLTYVEGEKHNIKITEKDDLVLAEAIFSIDSSF